ncbi:hypothetical protein RHSIM_Rhsim06G0188700 [Rhododendron simsii]|uniref:CCHC-type domain-containing protein n=1 Tax=Rhododendron simsii TaxID=118357 RepID=A0A834GWJ0_RHOSS|nr:hypothetical protein RHSIM_Rhsim06G0188700 [Rhododendron simsii]
MSEFNMNTMIQLTATNYAVWKPRMEDMLSWRDLYDPLELLGVKPADMKTEDWKKMNQKAVGLIRQCIGQEVFHHVAQETDVYTLWTKLEGMYQSKTSRNKALLMRGLVNLKLKSGNSVAVHSSGFQNLVNQLASVVMKLDDELEALLLLSSLPDDWETLVVSLINSALDGKLTTALVKDALFNEEARRKEMGTDYDDGSRALAIDGNRGRSPGRGNRNRRGGGSRSRPRGGTPISGSFTCYHCQEEGHIKRNCPEYKAEKGQGKDQSKDAAVVVHESDGELMIAMKSCCQAWDKWYRVFGWTRGTSIANMHMERTREYTELSRFFRECAGFRPENERAIDVECSSGSSEERDRNSKDGSSENEEKSLFRL